AGFLHGIERNARRRGANKREVIGSLARRLNQKSAPFKPMSDYVLAEAIDQRLAKCCEPGKLMAVRAGQLQPEGAFLCAFAEQAPYHEAVIALAGKPTHFTA